VSDIDAVTGLVSPCLLCGVVPSIDYLVDDGYWQDTVPSYLRAGVICLPCLVERVGTVAFEHVRLIYLTVGGTTRAFGGAGARIEALGRIKEAAIRCRRAFLMGGNAPPSELTAAGIALEAALAAKSPTPKPIAPEPQVMIRDWADRFDAKGKS